MSQSLYSQTHYEILEVSPDAPQDEIHRAYQSCKQTYSGQSPALYSMFSAEEAKELLKLIEEAYRVLSNQESRNLYDRKLFSQQQGPSMPKVNSSDTSQPRPSANSSSSAIPSGHKKTRFGTYKVDSVIEEAIQTATEFNGEFLKTIRDYKNIPIEAISDSTKISRTYLKAIEAEDFDSLPAKVFVRGFVTQYSKELGLNPQIVADSYMNIFNRYHNG